MMAVGHNFRCHPQQATHGGFILSKGLILKKVKKKIGECKEVLLSSSKPVLTSHLHQGILRLIILMKMRMNHSLDVFEGP
jgi:hypothetical protein